MGNLKYGLFIYGICQAVIFLLAFLFNDMTLKYDTGFSTGLFNLLTGGVMLLASVIPFIIRKNDIGRAMLIASGILLLAGVITCSIFPFKLYH